MATLATLKKKAHNLLQQYAKTDQGARSPITKALAEVLVEARGHFTTAEGDADWNGRTYAYRRWVREVFDEAHLRGEDSKRLQAAIRYHVGSVLREQLSAEELEDAGLIPQTPKERSTERRQQRAAVLNALSAKDLAGGSLLALTALKAIVDRIDADEIAALDEGARGVALGTITDLEKRLRALKKRLG